MKHIVQYIKYNIGYALQFILILLSVALYPVTVYGLCPDRLGPYAEAV